MDFSRFQREQQEGSVAVPSFLRPCAVLVGRNIEIHRRRLLHTASGFDCRRAKAMEASSLEKNLPDDNVGSDNTLGGCSPLSWCGIVSLAGVIAVCIGGVATHSPPGDPILVAVHSS